MGKMKNLLLMTLLVLSSFSISAKQIILGTNSNSQEEIPSEVTRRPCAPET